MYNNIKEFREFIANASDEQIMKAVEFISVVGFYEGYLDTSIYDDRKFLSKPLSLPTAVMILFLIS